MSAPTIERPPYPLQLELAPPPETLPSPVTPLQPGVAYLAYENGDSPTAGSHSYQTIMYMKRKLEAQGVNCTLSLHHTLPELDHQPGGGPDGHFVITRDSRRFALFVLDGVGEPGREALDTMQLYENEGLTTGDKIYHSGVVPRTVSHPAAAGTLAPQVAELAAHLTGFRRRMGRTQTEQWQGLRNQVAELQQHVRYLRSPDAHNATYADIAQAQEAVNAKNKEIRDYLADAVSGEQDSWVQLRNAYDDRINIGNLRLVHSLQADVASMEALRDFRIQRNAALYPDGWPEQDLAKQEALMKKIMAHNDRIRELLNPVPTSTLVPLQEHVPAPETTPAPTRRHSWLGNLALSLLRRKTS